jgi:hypothetical protein
MKKTVSIFISAVMVALFLAACWNPSVKEVPLTAPWDKMNLPIKENARVWFSSDKEVRVVHKAGKADVAKSYLEALEKGGWKFVDGSTQELVISNFQKGSQHLRVDTGDFPEGGTNVIVRVLE